MNRDTAEWSQGCAMVTVGLLIFLIFWFVLITGTLLVWRAIF